MPGNRWTFKDVIQLRRLAKSREPANMIADMIGRTPNAVRKKAELLGVHLNPDSGSMDYAKRFDILVYLTDNPDATVTETAVALNRTRQCVGEMIRRMCKVGLLVKTGTHHWNRRYRPTRKWKANDGRHGEGFGRRICSLR